MDRHRRDLERAAAAGDPYAAAQLLQERLRSGELRAAKIHAAAVLGDPAARLIASGLPVPKKWPRIRHFNGCEPWGDNELTRHPMRGEEGSFNLSRIEDWVCLFGRPQGQRTIASWLQNQGRAFCIRACTAAVSLGVEVFWERLLPSQQGSLAHFDASLRSNNAGSPAQWFTPLWIVSQLRHDPSFGRRTNEYNMLTFAYGAYIDGTHFPQWPDPAAEVAGAAANLAILAQLENGSNLIGRQAETTLHELSGAEHTREWWLAICNRIREEVVPWLLA